jgi:hypothetical protein
MKKDLDGKLSVVEGPTCIWGNNVMIYFEEMRNGDVE